MSFQLSPFALLLPPSSPCSQPPKQPHQQKRDGFWSAGRKEVLGVMGRGGGGVCHSTVKRNARGAMRMRCRGISPHRTVGRMEKGCLIPSLCLRIVRCKERETWGYNGNRQHVMGREGKPGRGKASIPRCLLEQANSAQN